MIDNSPGDNPPDFAVMVPGNNMEPLLVDGDILLVKKQDAVEHGEIGVFIIDGIRRVKKMSFKNGYVRLRSIDTSCDDITLDMINTLTCEGKVVKVLHSGERKFEKI